MTAAMILAAGRGERLRPVTDAMPKALVEVGGTTLIERQLQRLANAGIGNVVINLGWFGEQIAARLGSGHAFGLQIVYSPEYDDLLDTGGGIRRALPLLGDSPFWVINADVFTDFVLPRMTLGAAGLAHLVLVPTPAYRKTADFDLVDGKVRNSDQPDLTFSGIAYYRPEFFAGSPDGRFSVVPLMQQAADRGQLEGSVFTGTWEDVGTPERLAALNASL